MPGGAESSDDRREPWRYTHRGRKTKSRPLSRLLGRSFFRAEPINIVDVEDLLKDQFQGELDLSGGVGGVGFHEVLWLLIVARVGSKADFRRALHEGRGISDEAV